MSEGGGVNFQFPLWVVKCGFFLEYIQTQVVYCLLVPIDQWTDVTIPIMHHYFFQSSLEGLCTSQVYCAHIFECVM
jgi:hypothetical protein